MISVLIGIGAMLAAIYMVYTLPIQGSRVASGPPVDMKKKSEDVLAAIQKLKEQQKKEKKNE